MSEQGWDTGEQNPAAAGRRINRRKVPVGILFLEKIGLCSCCPGKSHKLLVYFLTFFTYTVYYIARKPFSVVKVALCPECVSEDNTTNGTQGWPPFEGDYARTLLGSLDYSWLFTYAVALYFSGWIGDRVNLRYFLTFGTIGSGVSAGLLGVAYFADIHHFSYFVVFQIMGGIMQSTGWPSILAVMSHWFGKQRRGFILGLWTMSAPLGSILGIVISSFWADAESPWGWAFIVPALITVVYGFIIFLFLNIDPQHVGLPPPVHHLKEDKPAVSQGVTNPLTEAADRNGEVIVRDRAKADCRAQNALEKNTAVSQGVTNPLTEAMDRDGEVIVRDRAKADCRAQNALEKASTETVIGMDAAGRVGAEEQHSKREDPQEQKVKPKAVGFFRALLIPGVIEFSLALFFNKLVSFTFFYWLPFYVQFSYPDLGAKQSGWLAILYDVGAIIGAVSIGLISDVLHARATTCVGMLILAVPGLFLLSEYGDVHLAAYAVLLVLCGAFINGPYSLITSAVASDLGTHKSLKDNQQAKATVAAIINGTGSLGGALGPLLIGLITDTFGWTSAFYILMAACLMAGLLLLRLVVMEMKRLVKRFKKRRSTYGFKEDEEEDEWSLEEMLGFYFKETTV